MIFKNIYFFFYFKEIFNFFCSNIVGGEIFFYFYDGRGRGHTLHRICFAHVWVCVMNTLKISHKLNNFFFFTFW